MEVPRNQDEAIVFRAERLWDALRSLAKMSFDARFRPGQEGETAEQGESYIHLFAHRAQVVRQHCFALREMGVHWTNVADFCAAVDRACLEALYFDPKGYGSLGEPTYRWEWNDAERDFLVGFLRKPR